MAAVQQERVQQDWEREAIDLKRQGLVSNDIAEAVGKSASTVRKVIARAREAGDLPPEIDRAIVPTAEPGEHLTHVRTGATFQVGEEQTTVDDFTVPPEDDPEYEAPERDLSNLHEIDEDVDPLTTFRQEAGEAVGPMPEREMDGGVTVEHRLAGTRQMALDLGPNAAPVTGATIQFKSLKHESGHFGMGDIVTGTFTARVVGIPAKEAFDKDSEEYRAKPIAYVAEITEFEYEAVGPDD